MPSYDRIVPSCFLFINTENGDIDHGVIQHDITFDAIQFELDFMPDSTQTIIVNIHEVDPENPPSGIILVVYKS
jgi:hypothetical protein